MACVNFISRLENNGNTAFCSSCGGKIEDGAKFCSGCGKSVNGVDDVSVASYNGSNGNFEKEYTVTIKTKLYANDKSSENVVSVLQEGDIVTFIETGANVSVGNKKAELWKVKTQDNKIGYCFSELLKEEICFGKQA